LNVGGIRGSALRAMTWKIAHADEAVVELNKQKIFRVPSCPNPTLHADLESAPALCSASLTVVGEGAVTCEHWNLKRLLRKIDVYIFTPRAGCGTSRLLNSTESPADKCDHSDIENLLTRKVE